jgi:hypothetical protein
MDAGKTMKVLTPLFYSKRRPSSRVCGPSPPAVVVIRNSGRMWIRTVRAPEVGDMDEISSPSTPAT